MDLPIAAIVSRWKGSNSPHQQSRCTCTLGGCCDSVESLARLVSVSHSTMHRRLRSGTLTVDEADQWAASLGWPLRDVWPDWDRDDWEPEFVEECEVAS